jgi:hypothetical protein
MKGRISGHIRSNVVGYVALFVALSGTAYAVDGPLAGQNQVGSLDIIDGEVKNADLDGNSVGTGKIADGNVRSNDVADDSTGFALTGTDIADESLSGSDIGFGAVESADISDGSIAADDIDAGAVGTAEIFDGGVENADLAANSVTGGKVFPSSLTGSDVQTNSLSSSDIATDAVTGAEVAPAAVGASEVVNGSLGTAEFASSIPAARVTRTVNQGILNDDETALNFNSERYDTAGVHSTSANLSRLTAPVDGIYLVTAQVQWDVNGFGNRALALVRSDGVTVARNRIMPGTDPVNAPAVNLTTVVSLSAGDFIEAVVFQNSGGNLSVLRIGQESPEFTMTWLAPGP